MRVEWQDKNHRNIAETDHRSLKYRPAEGMSQRHELFYRCRLVKYLSQVHILPMSDFVYELLEQRSRQKTSEFIFPADSKSGYISEPKKAVLKVAELSDVPFTLHDLRRTFATVADSIDLPDMAYFGLKLWLYSQHSIFYK